MSTNKFLFSLLLLSLLALIQCKKDNARPEIAQETINGVTMTFIASDGSDTSVVSYSDPDGEGGTDPIIVGDTIKVNTIYQASLKLWNGSSDVTGDIQNSAQDHQVFFSASSELGLTFLYDDSDDDEHPVGLLSTWNSSRKGTGVLRMTLVHQPDKSASGVAQGNLSTAGGKIDIEVDFPFTTR
ncbi:MAG: hypothetical protein KDC57_14285 [Saprospiraceae bacterium]|nr:hypothetical protein [Saprospiraceae bacterium]